MPSSHAFTFLPHTPPSTPMTSQRRRVRGTRTRRSWCGPVSGSGYRFGRGHRRCWAGVGSPDPSRFRLRSRTDLHQRAHPQLATGKSAAKSKNENANARRFRVRRRRRLLRRCSPLARRGIFS
jgi:hypothetical protein